jgi:hypothetical protein
LGTSQRNKLAFTDAQALAALAYFGIKSARQTFHPGFKTKLGN